MKNKDKIKYRIGQIWNFEGCRLAALERETILMAEGNTPYYLRWKPNAPAFTRLLECPVMGDMRNHLIVTQEQRDKYKRPDCAEWFDDDDDTWNLPSFKKWIDDYLYRVPADFDGWELKEWEAGICIGCRAKVTNQGDCTNKKCKFYMVKDRMKEFEVCFHSHENKCKLCDHEPAKPQRIEPLLAEWEDDERVPSSLMYKINELIAAVNALTYGKQAGVL